MTEDISKMKWIRAAYKEHCIQGFKKGEKLITRGQTRTKSWGNSADRC